MTAPNFKAEAHKAVERILSIPSRTERDKTLEAFLKDVYERGEAAAARPKREPKERRPGRKRKSFLSVAEALDGLQALKVAVTDLGNELKTVR